MYSKKRPIVKITPGSQFQENFLQIGISGWYAVLRNLSVVIQGCAGSVQDLYSNSNKNKILICTSLDIEFGYDDAAEMVHNSYVRLWDMLILILNGKNTHVPLLILLLEVITYRTKISIYVTKYFASVKDLMIL